MADSRHTKDGGRNLTDGSETHRFAQGADEAGTGNWSGARDGGENVPADPAPGVVDEVAGKEDFSKALDAALDAIRTALDDDEKADVRLPRSPEVIARRVESRASSVEVSGAGVYLNGMTHRTVGLVSNGDALARQSAEYADAHAAAQVFGRRGGARLTAIAGGGSPASSGEGDAPHFLAASSAQPQAPADYHRRGSTDAAPHPVPADRVARYLRPPEVPTEMVRVNAANHDPYWSGLMNDIQNDLEDGARPRPATRPLRPEDVPGMGAALRDQAHGGGRKAMIATVSGIALTAVLGFAALMMWRESDLPDVHSAARQTATEQPEATSPAPAATSNAPAGLSDTSKTPPTLAVTPIGGQSGTTVPVEIAVTPTPGERTAVLISGLPDGVMLSAGVDTGKGVWIVKPADLGGLSMSVSPDYKGVFELKVELVAPNGLTLDVQTAEAKIGAPQIAADKRETIVAGLAPKPVKTAVVNLAMSENPPPARAEPAPRVTAAPPAPAAASATTAAAPAPGNEVRLASVNPAREVVAPSKSKIAPVSTKEALAMMERGDKMMGLGDIASARLFYQRAAEAGHAGAAFALGQSYDPAFLSQNKVRGLTANPKQAMAWYIKAGELGAPQAQARISALKAQISSGQ